MSTTDRTFTMTIAAPSTAPTWWADDVAFPPGTWKAIASVGTLDTAKPNPVAQVAAVPGFTGSAGFITMAEAWTGGGVDQTRNEFLLVANGGHADYPGNEAYGLNLMTQTPAWRRISDPTPNNVMDATGVQNGDYKWSDGRCRAMHNCNCNFIDGRMWYPMLNSLTNGAGNGDGSKIAAWDRNNAAILTANSTNTPWTNDPGPWQFWNTNLTGMSTQALAFGNSCVDKVRHRIWEVSNYGSTGGTDWWWISTQGATLGQMTGFYGYTYTVPCWVVCAHDLGIIVMGDAGNQKFHVLNIATNTWSAPTNISGTGYFLTTNPATGHDGAVYVQANHSIAVGHPNAGWLGKTIYKLAIPMLGGNYNPTGQWTWTQITPSTGADPASTPAWKAHEVNSAFNIVENMGDGRSAFVFVAHTQAPTYVYKVPLAGL